LSAWDQIPAALALLRDATMLAILAVLEARGGPAPEPTPEGAFRELGSLIESGASPAPPAGFERVRDLFTDGRHLVFDELPKSEAFERRAEADAMLAWLRRQFDSRTLSQIKLSRALRVGATGVVKIGR